MREFEIGEEVEILPQGFRYIKNYSGPRNVNGKVKKVLKEEAFVQIGPFHHAWIRNEYLLTIARAKPMNPLRTAFALL